MPTDPISNARRAANYRNTGLRRIGTSAAGADGTLFDESVYADIRETAARWGERVSDVAQTAILVPAGLWSFSQFSSFPDLDISTLGIANHRYFLFHSGAVVWMLHKIYQARLAKSAGSTQLSDKVIDRMLGIVAASGAYAVGIHLAFDVVQPKSVVFPFIGSPVDGTLVDDNLWFLGNALYCFRTGNRMFALALGDDLPRVKEFVKRTIVEPVGEGLLDAVPGRR